MKKRSKSSLLDSSRKRLGVRRLGAALDLVAKTCGFLLTLWLMITAASAQTRFVAMDLIIDPEGEPLAAYQVEIGASSNVKIVGVEGGEHPEFRKAPYYDPKGIQHERLIVAAFSTADAGKLPNTPTRVLTIHIECEGEPKLETNLKVAANARGQKIIAKAVLIEGNRR
jgi:hypothetical protein